MTTDILNNSGLGFEITVLKYAQCTAAAVETFKDYGLVFIDSHGMIDAFLLGKDFDYTNVPKNEASIKSAINNQLGSGAVDKISTGKLELASSVKGNPKKSDWVKSLKPKSGYSSWWLSGKYIQTLPPMPKTVIVGNMCFSGWVLPSFYYPEKTFTDPNLKVVTYPAHTESYENAVGKSFIGRNPISYYGYTKNESIFQTQPVPKGTSRKVSDGFCKQMEPLLVKRLAEKVDSTGIANLEPDNKTEFFDPYREFGDLFFRHYGADDYSYAKCGEPFKDERDGHIYKSVCIGKQVWMAENLNYEVTGSDCYDKLPANCNAYGKLYTREMVLNGAAPSSADPSGVQGICPKGWHVPSAAEWNRLFDFLGGKAVAGTALKANSSLWTTNTGPGTNSSGFNALPSGEWVYTNSDVIRTFQALGVNGLYHTTTELHPGLTDVVILSNKNGIANWLTYAPVTLPNTTKGNVACRCVKD